MKIKTWLVKTRYWSWSQPQPFKNQDKSWFRSQRILVVRIAWESLLLEQWQVTCVQMSRMSLVHLTIRGHNWGRSRVIVHLKIVKSYILSTSLEGKILEKKIAMLMSANKVKA